MRKIIVTIAVLLLVLSIGAASVFAYGGRHHQAAADMVGSGTETGDRMVQYDNRVNYNCMGQNCPYYDTDSCYYHDGSYDHNGYHSSNGYQNYVSDDNGQDDRVNCYNSGGHHGGGGGHHGYCR